LKSEKKFATIVRCYANYEQIISINLNI